MDRINIRFATQEDTGLILRFIKELASFEKLEHEVVADEPQIISSLFGETPQAECVIAELDGRPKGFAIFFHNYSTFLCRHGLYLEDLYVTPEARGKGIGIGLLKHLAELAIERGCGRMEWWVLDWNTPAIDLYKSLEAEAMDEFTIYRLKGKALEKFSQK